MRIFIRAYDRLLDCLGVVSAALIGFVAVGISVDVIMRNTGLGVLSWMLETAEYCLFLATFLGAPWVLSLGAHVRVDIVVDALPRRSGRALEIAADLVGLATSVVILYYSIAISLAARAAGSRIIKEFIFPEWWVYAVVVVSSSLLIVEFLRRLHRALRTPATQRA